MSFIEGIKEKARQNIKTIVLPESNDIRVLKAASSIIKEGFAKVCPFCGATIMIYQFEDGPKHMTKCPNNPYK